MNIHRSPRFSIACTGRGMVFGLRMDIPGMELLASDHIGCIDAPVFLPTGHTTHGDNGLTVNLRVTTVLVRDRRGDFPSKEEREEDRRIAEAQAADRRLLNLIERFERDEAVQQFADNI